jgi:aspartate aminotransferase-like enzyme
MTFGRNFLPGPTGVHPDVMAAMTEPMFFYLGPRMRPILEEIQPTLQSMLGTTRPVFTVTCSGTGVLEMAIRNAVRHRVLVVVGGYFGEYLAGIAERCGKEVIRVSVPLGRAIEADQLEQLLDGPRVDAVAVVHSESSTGALAPIAELAAVVRKRPDVLFLVDAVSSAAGHPIEMDRIGADFVATGSQKALALPPGLGLGAASERLEARARTIEDTGHYFSVPRWIDMATNYRLAETPALSQYLALQVQVRRIAAAGGWQPRWERHRRLAERFHAWAAGQTGAALLAPEGRRSHCVSAIRLVRHQAAEVAGALADQGFLVGQAIDPAHGQIIRVGHMGDLELEHLDALLETLGALLS